MKSVSRHHRRPNRLFRGLLAASFAIHVLVFLHVSGLYRSDALTYIELTVQDLSKPPTRSIPRPRDRPKPVCQPTEIERLNVIQQAVPHLKPLKIEPDEADLPDSLVERISVPDIPVTTGVHITAWDPGDHLEAASTDYATSGSYLEMVRFKIERHKEYPEPARTGQVEGSVTVRFTITTQGTVREIGVARSSRRALLDEAAIQAVKKAAPFPKPPGRLFKGDVPLEITIVFELT
jgi:protein TonB